MCSDTKPISKAQAINASTQVSIRSGSNSVSPRVQTEEIKNAAALHVPKRISVAANLFSQPYF